MGLQIVRYSLLRLKKYVSFCFASSGTFQYSQDKWFNLRIVGVVLLRVWACQSRGCRGVCPRFSQDEPRLTGLRAKILAER